MAPDGALLGNTPSSIAGSAAVMTLDGEDLEEEGSSLTSISSDSLHLRSHG